MNNFRRRLLLNQTKNTLLPSKYQQVEYIESTGNQYINSNYRCKVTSKFVADYQYTIIQSSSAIFGALVDTGERKNVSFATSIDTTAWALQCEDIRGVKLGTTDIERHIVELDVKSGNLILDDSILYSWTPQGKIPNIPVYIFARNGQTETSFIDEYSSSKIYSFKIYEDRKCVMDLVPCYRKSDIKIGMYDIVNNQFYASLGKVALLKGDDIDNVS